ncbi:MAG TPA: hypothetical protein PLU49_12020 [Saprospiraceae bacterium]|nr:hypothetical protein [Saprospiraceae bacterium]
MESSPHSSRLVTVWHKLKTKWHIKSNFQLAIILVVFTLTGFTAAYLKTIIFQWMGMSGNTPVWQRTLILLLLLIPLYKALLIIYGTIFGQFRFFKNFILKFLLSIWRLVSFQTISK